LAGLESILSQKLSEIDLLAAGNYIDARVRDSQVIPSKIENEYRIFDQKTVAIFNHCPDCVHSIYDKCMTQILAFLKLRRIGGMDSSTGTSGRSTNPRQNPPRPAKKHAMRRGKEVGSHLRPAELFATPAGSRYQEVEPLVLIPPETPYPDSE
jgi:hypothetical protein